MVCTVGSSGVRRPPWEVLPSRRPIVQRPRADCEDDPEPGTRTSRKKGLAQGAAIRRHQHLSPGPGSLRRIWNASLPRASPSRPVAPRITGHGCCAGLAMRSSSEVQLIAPHLVKPYVKRGKNDAADAEALCEAMSRPTMRFVPVKTAEQQAA